MKGEVSFSPNDLEVARCFTTGLTIEAAIHPKPGLVDRVKPLAEIDVFRLSTSAVALHPYFAQAAKLGRRGEARGNLGKLILDASTRSLSVQRGGNAHLGAIILTVPLAAAAGSLGSRSRSPEALRRAAVDTVARLDWKDASNVFRAIEQVRPGGLGRVCFLDVVDRETYALFRRLRAGLLQAFEPYRGRDMVADELVEGYPLVFDECLDALLRWERASESLEVACVNALLTVMGRRPDTHIIRRRNILVARIAQSMALTALRLGGASSERGLEAIAELDNYLRRLDARPGSSADILAASLSVRLLLGLRV
ncbi:MAG: triphosphoribosyl-dephospho-CoA synthase [Nitrososphaerota archaeon]